MRIELEVQVMLDFLLDRLDIPKMNDEPADEVRTAYDLVRMERFPPFSSPASKGDPIYDLKPEEEGKTPLELLKLGLCRAVVDMHLVYDDDKAPNDAAHADDKEAFDNFVKTRNDLIAELGKAAATQRPLDPVFDSWVRHRVHEDDYWIIQRYARIPVLYGDTTLINLHTMGFWNLMAAYLSHNALTKVRDLGTFYHLIPENPNAAEWLTSRISAFLGHHEQRVGRWASYQQLSDSSAPRSSIE